MNLNSDYKDISRTSILTKNDEKTPKLISNENVIEGAYAVCRPRDNR